ncbi:heavy metal-associated isoprenylated plant protein 3-like isoform X2 [Populus alba x Populus x berolinensis]|nr:heavy metal-associated isoprenylated plant protein 3-like isoform X2 [Populus alba x Populus x berolinensis]
MAKKKNNNSNNNNEVEKKEEEKSKGSDGGGKKEEKGPVPVLLKVEMHCEGCVSKIVKSVRAFEGVETVKAEPSSNKLAVTGKIDPLKVRDYLHLKTKKQVDLISPQPQKQDTNKNNNGSGNKEDKKSNDKKPDSAAKPKEAPVSTAVLKLGLHCQGCIKKIQKMVLRTKGVQEIGIDTKTELVTVKGTMDVKALAETLKERLKRPVDIVPPKKEKEGGKEAENAAEGGGGKKKGGGGNGGGQDAAAAAAAAKLEEINRMEFTVQPGFGYMGQPIYGNGYVGQPVYASHGPDYGYGYEFGHAPHQGYGFGHAPHQGYRPVQAYPDHLQFNDENPNACSIM